MKLVLVLLVAGFCALAWSSPAGETTTYHSQYKVADKTLLEKQKKVLDLFKHINQPFDYDEYVEIENTFKIEESKDHYNHPEVVDKIMEYYHHGYQLPKGEIFSVSYPEHLEQAIAVFDLMYYAKDFDTFYKTAVIARHWVNEGLFLYSFSLAVIHRADTYGVIIPPIYEVNPQYFHKVETMHEAYKYKQIWNEKKAESHSGKYPGYTAPSNYSGFYLNLHPEQSLSYYLEDIGINAFYYYYYLFYPFWMDGEKYDIHHDRRGELYYFVHQQLQARYYMERLSHGFGQIHAIDFEEPIETPFYPSLQYPNGFIFPERPRFAKVSDYFYQYGEHISSKYAYSYSFYKDYKRRISDAIDRGFAYDSKGEKVDLYHEDGMDHLGNLIQANPDSPDNHYYGPWLTFARHLLGYSFTPLGPYKIAPGALEHMETSLRDPGFYQMYKWVMLFYGKYENRLEPYTKKQLMFPGVSIDKVEMDRLVTYFEDFYSDLSQGVYYSDEDLKQHENHFFVRAKQSRLNHKPFTYKIHVQSDKETKAVMKIFIGPKYDEYGRYINISLNRWNFFELDKFVVDLHHGDNLIKRSSYESIIFGPDRTSYYDLYKQVMSAYDGKSQFTITGKDNYFTYPQRYMLPMGSQAGTTFQFFFVVYPYKPYTHNKPQDWTYFYPRPGVGGPYLDDSTLLYPLDRPIKYGQLFYSETPNFYFYTTKIYHKVDINAVPTEN